MAVFDFPTDPAVNDEYTSGGVTYTWNGYGWLISAMESGVGDAGLIRIADNPPSGVSSGDMWWESDAGRLWLWYDDGNSQQWVQVNSAQGPKGDAGGPGPVGPAGPVAPSWAMIPVGFRATKSANQTGLLSDTPTKLVFGNEVYDRGSFYDPALSRWTPPAGLVHIDGSVYAQGFSTGGGHYLFVYKNGVALESTLVTSPYTNDGLQIGVDDTANGTDYYELWLKLYGGGFVNADVYAFFDGHVVGGPKGDAGVAGAPGPAGPAAPSWALIPVGFRAHKNGISQTTTNSTFTKLTFTTEDYDQGGYYDAANSRFTPPAGAIHIDGTVYAGNLTASNGMQLALYKNGAMLKFTQANNAGGTEGIILSIDDIANGTDYYELWLYAVGSPSVSGTSTLTWFCGHVIGGPKGDVGPTGPAAPAWALIPVGFRAIKSVDQTGIPSGVTTKLAFPVEDYDKGGYYDAPNSRWTPPAGLVHFDAQAVGTNLSASNPFNLYIYKNGAALKSGAQYVTPGHSSHIVLVGVDDTANGTDYYECWMNALSPSTGAVTANPSITWFSGHMVGGPKGDTGAQGVPGPSGSGSGDVIRFGAPVAGQVAVWTDANTIKGVNVYTAVPVALINGGAADFSTAQAFTAAVAGPFVVANPSTNPAVGTYTSITISMTAAGAVTWGTNFKGLTNYTQSTWASGTMRDHLTFRWSGTTYDLIGVAKGVNQ